MSIFLTEKGRRSILGPYIGLPKPIVSNSAPLLERLKREIAAKAAPAKVIRPYSLPKGLRREDAKKQPADSTWEKCQMYGAVLASVTGKFLLRRPATPGNPGKSILEAPGGLEMASQDGWTWPRSGLKDSQEHPVDAVMRAVASETGYKAHVMGTISGTYGSCCYFLMRPKGWDWTRMKSGVTQELRWALFDEASDLLEGNDLVILEQAHSRLVAGIEAYSPDEQRDDHGRWSQGGEAFLSPHGDEPLTFDQAVDEAGGAKQKQFEADGIALGKKLGLTVKPESAVGDTKEWGTENSVIAHLGAVKDYDTVRYWAAKMGSQADQLSVIPFITDRKGTDRIYRFELQGDAKAVRDILDKEGIDYRTLVVGKGSSKVTVFDSGMQLTDKMQRIRTTYGTEIQITKGSGEILPPDSKSREASQQVYNGVIADYERARGGLHRLHGAGDGLRYSRSASASAKINATFSEDEPRDDHGRWTNDGGSERSFTGLTPGKSANPGSTTSPIRKAREALDKAGAQWRQHHDSSIQKLDDQAWRPGEKRGDFLKRIADQAAQKKVASDFGHQPYVQPLTLTPPAGTVPVKYGGALPGGKFPTSQLADPAENNRNLGRPPDFPQAPLGAFKYDEGQAVHNANEDYAKVVEQRGGFTRRLTDDVPHGAISLQEQGLAKKAADAARKAAGLAPQGGEGLSTYKQRVADAQPHVKPTTPTPSSSPTPSSYHDSQDENDSDHEHASVRTPPREVPPVDLEKASPDEKVLLTGRVTSTTDAPGDHINTVKFLEFENGVKAVFKPDPRPGQGDNRYSAFGSNPDDWVRSNVTPGYTTEREAGAYQVAKLVGMDDMVAPVVIRKLDGERGALLKYVPGEDANAVSDPWDGMKDMLRAAAFDYVIGNEDRHMKNWVVENSGSDAKLHLIDHGYAFPDIGEFDPDQGQQKFTHHAAQLYGSGAGDEDGSDAVLKPGRDFRVPFALAKPYQDHRDEIMKALDNLGLPGDALQGVDDRIGKLSQASNWSDLV